MMKTKLLKQIPLTHSRCKINDPGLNSVGTGMFHFKNGGIKIPPTPFIKGGLILLIFLTCSRILGVTNYVSLSGTHTSPYDTWAKAANDIQSAVDAADPDNVVLVADGTYNLAAGIKILTNIVIKSVNGSAVAIVDGGNAVRCFMLNGGNVVINGFTIRNGKTTNNGGGINASFSRPKILNCTISGNEAEVGGGIICLMSGIVSNCIITGNSSLVGGGMVFYYGSDVYDCIISNNIATAAAESMGGGVLFLVGGNIKGSIIVDNYALRIGGGVVFTSNGSMEDCIVSGNSSLDSAGGVYLNDGAIILRSTVSGNDSMKGGGIYCSGSSTVRDCFINGGNSAGQDGGGIYCGNLAKIMDSVITGNSAGNGGGIYSAAGIVENCTIAGNSGTGSGEGLYCNNGSNINSIIYFNTGLAGENIHNAGSVYYSHCCSLPAMTGEGNTDVDPDFADRLTGDFQLSIGSPCIDTGVYLPWMSGAKDIAGNDRIMGETVDMGAYEYPLIRAKSAEWRYKSKKNKGTIKGKYIVPSFTNYFNDGWQIGMKNGETGALIDGPRELIPNKKYKVWKFKEKKQAQITYKAKKDTLVYKVWAAIPPTNIIFLVQTNAPGVTFSDSEKSTRKEIEFYLCPEYPEKTDGWRRLVPKSVSSEQ